MMTTTMTTSNKTSSTTRASTSSSNGGGGRGGSASTAAAAAPDGDWSYGKGLIPGRDVIGPLFLMASTPVFSILFWNAMVRGEWIGMARSLRSLQDLRDMWPSPWDEETWRLIGYFAALQLMLMRLVPGKEFKATKTPTGHVPVYKANGLQCYLATMATVLGLAYYEQFDPAVIYDKFGNILSSMNVFALAFCAVLLIKGYVFPSTEDSGTTGSWVSDFYWGMELYPRIFGWDVKVFTNCRMGMMFWAVALVGFCFKNAQLNAADREDGGGTGPNDAFFDDLFPFPVPQYAMLASCVLQWVYITKFFAWEAGYMCSMDIQHDRAGYYICWGCLVWVPAVYTSQSFWLTTHAPDLSLATAAAITAAGLICIWINYDSDRQRYNFRQSKGKDKIWGKIPNKIVAKYYVKGGSEKKKSLLLVDGWWKISRHFHYVPEILASFFWTVPAGFDEGLMPYFYVVYLTILLTDRAYRDDDRCQKKYGKYWKEYCDAVPYKIIPGVV